MGEIDFTNPKSVDFLKDLVEYCCPPDIIQSYLISFLVQVRLPMQFLNLMQMMPVIVNS